MSQRNQPPLRYKFYPSLLNDFHNYITEEGYEKDDELIPFVTLENLIDKINRVPYEMHEKAAKGKDFENAVCGLPSEFGNIFDPELIERFQSYLPERSITQHYVECVIGDVLFYGYTDFIGEGRIVDAKTTASYTFPKYLTDHQLLYLKALESDGVKQMDFLITNFTDIFKESYYIDNLDLSVQTNEIEMFKDFLSNQRHLITDKKIFAEI